MSDVIKKISKKAIDLGMSASLVNTILIKKYLSEYWKDPGLVRKVAVKRNVEKVKLYLQLRITAIDI